jgi:ankyrin repeat protein
MDKNGSSPLELAIRSGSLDMVELLLKDATVHTVQRCWIELDEGQRSKPIGEVLRTKVC